MTITADDVLSGRAQRYESCRFDVYERGRNRGTLMLDKDSAPGLSNDTARTLRRQLDGLRVVSRPLWDVDDKHVYVGEFDSGLVEVRPWWLLRTGDTITEYPLGVMLFADDSLNRATAGSTVDAQMVDRCMLLDQPVEQTLGFAAGEAMGWALHVLAALAGIPLEQRMIEGSALTFGAPVAYVPGRDTYLAAMEKVCTAAGFLPPYFNNDGLLVCRSAPDFSNVPTGFNYGRGGTVLDATVVESSDHLVAPNRYVAVGNQADTVVTAIYNVPDDAPNSFANTGRIRRRTVDVPGVADGWLAAVAAYLAYVTDSRSAATWLHFSTLVDPRHDTFDVINFDGTRFLETSWSMACLHGAPHQHACRGIYGA